MNNNRATSSDISFALSVIMLTSLFVLWKLHMIFFLFLSLSLFSMILLIEARQAYIKKQTYYFSQQLLRGLAVIGAIVMLVYFRI
ncbi:hypothetical protein ACFOZ1_01470 [Gracilibacillus marinus]|uniref:DUF4181 domain-containing protein n=1 Tax=Gracilibacillus marinus TaxID=630535 RepID=A0ABV8VQI5_9BACI